VKISGRKGRYEQFINGTYEQMGAIHNDRQVFVTREAQASYLFHTGKSRWVVSKRVDDGSACYCYVEDTGTDPVQAKGSWICFDQDKEWRADTKVHITGALASNDKFVKLRMSLDAELDKLGLQSADSLKALWKRLDFNGNNIVSLAEIDKFVLEMVSGGTWPAWLNNKPALMRAYKKTTLRGEQGDAWVHKDEFADLLLNLFWFNKLFMIFSEIGGGDRRMDLGEFQRGLAQLGLQLTGPEVQQEFKKMDTNGGGQVLFVEFCGYIRNRVSPDHNKSFDSDISSGETCGKVMRKSHGNRGTHVHYITKKCGADFDALETKVKAIIADPAQLGPLWHSVDFDGNNIVSLDEIDKVVVDQFPLLNHKPALARAYKAATRAGDGDDLVQKHEFKSLLVNVFYFNKLFWLFENVEGDQDKKMNFAEFKRSLTVAGVMKSMSESEAQNDFRKIDKIGGGVVLFDDFCAYFAAKMCPQSLQTWG